MASQTAFRNLLKRPFLCSHGKSLTAAALFALTLNDELTSSISTSSHTTLLESADDSSNLASRHKMYLQKGSDNLNYVKQAAADQLQSNSVWVDQKISSIDTTSWDQKLASIDTVQTLLDAIQPEDTSDKTKNSDLSNNYNKKVLVKPRTNFESLAAEIINDENGISKDFEFNSKSEIPVENDMFIGKIMLVLSPESSQNNASGRSRFEFAIQGRLKRVPKGGLYCGAEISNQVTMNRVSRGLSRLLLNFLRRLVGGDMEYSFGTEDRGAHISFPLASAMETCIVTKPGDVPPNLSKQHSLSDTVSSTKIPDWNTNDTYTMSFGADSVDLPSWKIVSPCNVDLSHFWGNSLLRLVVYEKGDANEDEDVNKYLLALQVKFLDQPISASLPSRKIPIRYHRPVLLERNNALSMQDR